jgi:hypothetical protein
MNNKIWIFPLGKIHQEIFECSEFMKDLLKDHLSHTNGSTSDDNPLLFRLATPAECRAFLWALYAKYVPPNKDPHSHRSSIPF